MAGKGYNKDMFGDIRREDWKTLKPTVCGWGILDANYKIKKSIGNKKIWGCPYYDDWASMIKRCFGKSSKKFRPTYQDCTVCEEWRYLSNFIKWVDSQPNKDWVNCQLDKDFIVEGNRVYSPNTVVYVSHLINSFITDKRNMRGAFMIGVKDSKSKTNPYYARCNNPLTGLRVSLGHFKTELEAHKAWQAKKHEYACILADKQTDHRVAKTLRERYAPDKDWTNR